MFKKCLKYDLRAHFKIWAIAAAVILLLSLLCGIGIRSFFTSIFSISAMAESEQNVLPFVDAILVFVKMMIGFISYFIFITSMVIFASGTSIMLYIRYYSKFFTDQGYLTFTLPVKRSTQFWSKAVSGIIYSLGSALVSAIAVCVVLACMFSVVLFSPEAMQNFPIEEFKAWLFSENLIYSLVSLLLGILLTAAMSFATLMMQYLIITLAATMFRKLKVLSVIIAYYVVNNIIAVPVVYIGSYYAMFIVMFLAMGLISMFSVPILGWLCIYALMLLGIIAALTIGLMLAFFSIQRLERKLNLA